MKRFLLSLLLLVCLIVPRSASAAMFDLQKVADGVYAAVAVPGSKATSNGVVIITKYQVIVAGAHFSGEAIKDLFASISLYTPLPVRSVILTHHHRGFNYLDFDFPANIELLTSWQCWQALRSEYRDLKNPVTYFDKGITLVRDGRTIILSNAEAGHSGGDVLVYLPEDKILFASDLLFVDEIGPMADGHMRDWILNLEMMEKLDSRTIVPGIGPVSDRNSIRRFLNFFRDFMTELLGYAQKGDSPEMVLKKFPFERYKGMRGAEQYMKENVTRAYKELTGK